jgi:membrane protein DedA with SNARE-associated domain
MTALNLWLVCKILGFVLWVMIFFTVGVILLNLWKDMNGE